MYRLYCHKFCTLLIFFRATGQTDLSWPISLEIQSEIILYFAFLPQKMPYNELISAATLKFSILYFTNFPSLRDEISPSNSMRLRNCDNWDWLISHKSSNSLTVCSAWQRKHKIIKRFGWPIVFRISATSSLFFLSSSIFILPEFKSQVQLT